MQVILTKDLHPLGRKGQAVKVKPGYFRNFLLPQGVAVYATAVLLKKAADVNQKIADEQAKLKKDAENLRDELKGKTLHLKEKLTKKGTLYSKISAKEIVSELKSQFGIEISVQNVNLPTAIKSTGDHEVDIKLPQGVTGKLKLSIEGVE